MNWIVEVGFNVTGKGAEDMWIAREAVRRTLRSTGMDCGRWSLDNSSRKPNGSFEVTAISQDIVPAHIEDATRAIDIAWRVVSGFDGVGWTFIEVSRVTSTGEMHAHERITQDPYYVVYAEIAWDEFSGAWTGVPTYFRQWDRNTEDEARDLYAVQAERLCNGGAAFGLYRNYSCEGDRYEVPLAYTEGVISTTPMDPVDPCKLWVEFFEYPPSDGWFQSREACDPDFCASWPDHPWEESPEGSDNNWFESINRPEAGIA